MKSRMPIFMFTAMWLLALTLAYPYENTIKRSFPLSQQGNIRLNTQRGDINISTHGANEVKIEAVVTAEDKTELEKVNIEFEAGTDSLLIYPASTLISAKVNINYELKVPEGLKAVFLATQNGEIKARGNYGQIELKTTNGDIDFGGEFSGCQLKSANGDIEVYVKDTLKGNLTAESINGSIKITFNPGPGFTVAGHTVTGGIRSEFNTTSSSDETGSHLEGTVAEGTYKLDLKTVNGDIHLLKQ
jgi:DUF4097 and DUF4098 domain-containing protein YvlB